jgi:hypothetical protein
VAMRERRESDRATQAMLGKQVAEDRQILQTTTKILLSAVMKITHADLTLSQTAVLLSRANDFRDEKKRRREKDDILQLLSVKEKEMSESIQNLEKMMNQQFGPPPTKRRKEMKKIVLKDDDETDSGEEHFSSLIINDDEEEEGQE